MLLLLFYGSNNFWQMIKHEYHCKHLSKTKHHLGSFVYEDSRLLKYDYFGLAILFYYTINYKFYNYFIYLFIFLLTTI